MKTLRPRHSANDSCVVPVPLPALADIMMIIIKIIMQALVLHTSAYRLNLRCKYKIIQLVRDLQVYEQLS